MTKGCLCDDGAGHYWMRDSKGVYGPALAFETDPDSGASVVDCHRRMVWSSLPVASMVPSALYARLSTTPSSARPLEQGPLEN
jgi:hypothetical protein